MKSDVQSLRDKTIEWYKLKWFYDKLRSDFIDIVCKEY